MEIRGLIIGWFESVSRGDTSWAERHVSRRDAARLIGTDPNEWLDGERVAGFLTEEVRSMGGHVTIAPGDPEGFREGSVGWGVARPTLTLPNGQQVTPRWTAVFHQEDGEWKLVQIHASFGVPNEEVLGQ